MLGYSNFLNNFWKMEKGFINHSKIKLEIELMVLFIAERYILKGRIVFLFSFFFILCVPFCVCSCRSGGGVHVWYMSLRFRLVLACLHGGRGEEEVRCSGLSAVTFFLSDSISHWIWSSAGTQQTQQRPSSPQYPWCSGCRCSQKAAGCTQFFLWIVWICCFGKLPKRLNVK